MLNPFGGGDEMMHIHDRQPSLRLANVHASDLEFWLVNEIGVNRSLMPSFRREPGFYYQESTRFEVSGHVSNCKTEFALGFQVANRAEETRDHIELLVEIE